MDDLDTRFSVAPIDQHSRCPAAMGRVPLAHMSDMQRGKINQFRIDVLVRLATRVRLRPRAKLVA